METSTITSHAFINGIMERKAITFPVNKTVLLVAMRLNYPAPKEPVPQKIDMLFLQVIIHEIPRENNDMYQTEHDTLFSSIRKGEPFNDGEKSAHSTMVAIMGRMASYTGQKITYEKASLLKRT